MLAGAATKLKSWFARVGFEGEWYLIVIGAFIGTLTAFGALGFAFLLHEVEHFAGEARGNWPIWTLPALPMLGALASGLLVWRFASEAKGHGVPQVMKAIIQRNGRIPLRVGIVKVFASICTVGSGGSAGTEGPIVQIGATAGSFVGDRIKIPPQHLRTLVGCGAAAGIASIFNAPIAGVLFVLEILLRDFSIRVFSPIVVASVFSAATTHAFRGENEAIFFAGDSLAGYQFTAVELPSYMLLGVVCGLVAVVFNKMLHAGEDAFAKLSLHAALKPVVGALCLGAIGLMYIAGLSAAGLETPGNSPPFFGNGYETIRWLLEPGSYSDNAGILAPGNVATLLPVLALVVALKALATTFTLGSGGSGGVFAPSLFLGAVAGAAVGEALRQLGLLPAEASPAAYALVGMAAVVAGSTHAPLTAILILFELVYKKQFAW
ncbi:MAG: chloride channel protein [Planctomycetota bacterium]